MQVCTDYFRTRFLSTRGHPVPIVRTECRGLVRRLATCLQLVDQLVRAFLEVSQCAHWALIKPNLGQGYSQLRLTLQDQLTAKDKLRLPHHQPWCHCAGLHRLLFPTTSLELAAFAPWHRRQLRLRLLQGQSGPMVGCHTLHHPAACPWLQQPGWTTRMKRKCQIWSLSCLQVIQRLLPASLMTTTFQIWWPSCQRAT